MFYHLAVPGKSSVTIRNFGGKQEVVSLSALAENVTPGSVSEWVSCVVCGATWRDDQGHEGGVVLVRRWDSRTGNVHRVGAACRCPAGARLTALAKPTDREWRRALANARLRHRRGVYAITEDDVMKYLVHPRGEWFVGRWGFYCELFTVKGMEPRHAIRRAYIKTWCEISR
jgi:hypothetical protein